jgi:hypothetical protein
MKAGGQSALRVATLAVIIARRRLKKSLGGDCMVVPQWITEVGAGRKWWLAGMCPVLLQEMLLALSLLILTNSCMYINLFTVQDTTAMLGRASKFLQLNLLPCAPNGVPGSSSSPGLPAGILPVPMPASS